VNRTFVRGEASHTTLAALGLGGNPAVPVAVVVMIALALVFLAWVVGSDARTERLSRLLRSRRGGEER
jgi:hypothetical protein